MTLATIKRWDGDPAWTGCVHHTAVLEDRIDFGEDVEVGPLCFLQGPLNIGARVRIYPHCVIGTPGEHREKMSTGAIFIGEDTTIREHTVIQRGTGERETSVGARCLLMHGVHVAHDCVIGDDVTLSPGVVLGGHTRVHLGATLGIGAMTHQRTTIGAYAMVGMGAVVTRDVPPFAVVVGNPARFLRWNKTEPERAALTFTADRSFGLDSRRKCIEVP